jgi:hypothetical protein
MLQDTSTHLEPGRKSEETLQGTETYPLKRTTIIIANALAGAAGNFTAMASTR